MNDETCVSVDHVSKKFCKSLRRSMRYGISDISKNIFRLSSHPDTLRRQEFWAVDDASFEVRGGETLGLIGPNGGGKTTILKMLNGIFWPDKGRINIRGRVGALIEVGAGFHPLLTGRENIYVNAAILGMTKSEVNEKFDRIVDFAEIGDFIDTPVKHYSSGMFVRLGFAVASHCEPDILLIDEILAVGDEGFQKKCMNQIGSLRDEGMTTVLVSHNMHTISTFADRAVLMDKGVAHCFTNVGDAVKKYSKLFAGSDDRGLQKITSGSDNIAFYNESIDSQILFPGDPFCFSLEYESALSYDDVEIDLTIYSSTDTGLYFQATNRAYGKEINLPKGRNKLTIRIMGIPIHDSTAKVGVTIWTNKRTEQLLWWRVPVEFEGVDYSTGKNFLEAQYEIERCSVK